MSVVNFVFYAIGLRKMCGNISKHGEFFWADFYFILGLQIIMRLEKYPAKLKNYTFLLDCNRISERQTRVN